MVDCWPCQVAVTPILGRVWRPGVVFATGTPAGVNGLGGTFWVASSSRHVGTPFEDVSFTGCPFGYCLVTWADRPPPQDGSESAPFRPIPTFWYDSLSLKHLRGKLSPALARWSGARSDGAYPRPEDRGIAPVQSIMDTGTAFLGNHERFRVIRLTAPQPQSENS